MLQVYLLILLLIIKKKCMDGIYGLIEIVGIEANTRVSLVCID